MNLDYEYIQFLNEKVLEFLPAQKWKNGNKWNFKCPICGDGKTGRKHRAWWYNSTASFYCFNCGTGMSGIRFIEAMSGSNYEEIRREYVKLFIKSGINIGLSSQCEIPKDEPNIFQLTSQIPSSLKNNLTDKAKAYLKDRLVLDAPFRKDPLYSCFSKKDKSEYILIPWILNGVDAYYQINDFQKIHGSMKYMFPKDKKKIVYGLDNIDMSWNKIIVFEGAYDSMFVKNGIAVGTKAITDYQISIIRGRYPEHQIVISFDNDTAGISSMCRLMKKEHDFKFFKWFNNNTKEKDINDYVKSKRDVNVFSDKKILENLIFDKLAMKLWLMQNRLWTL